MRFIELENKINEIAKEKGYMDKKSQTYYSKVTDNIESIVYKILKEAYPNLFYTGYYITTNKGNVIIHIVNYSSVTIKVRKIKGDKVYNYGLEQYYYLKNVEVDVEDGNKTLESYYEKGLKFAKEKEIYKNNMIKKFEKFLKDKQLTYGEFLEYYELYKDNWYEIDKKLCKESD